MRYARCLRTNTCPREGGETSKLTNQQTMFYSDADIKLDDLIALCDQSTDLADYPHASDVQKDILIYQNAAIEAALDGADKEQALKAELCRALKDGPGVIVIKGAFADLSVMDDSTAAFHAIIEQEKAAGSGQGDHFGNNERIWNSLQKACLHDPALFIECYKTSAMAVVCEAWLGPNYQMTAQVNNVKPKGKAQSSHRDYHLGFQSQTTVAQYPAHMQIASQYLTLQGGVAQIDMPLVTGPTLFLPFTQAYEPGYMAYSRPEFRAYFDEHYVQLPLEKGDLIFFSPALFHGAGTNQSENDRLVNLFQVSSAFGRAMETVNRTAMIEAAYPALLERVQAGDISEREVHNVIACVAEGYSFPTNLDSDPPIGGNAPETQAQLMKRALDNEWALAELMDALKTQANRKVA